MIRALAGALLAVAPAAWGGDAEWQKLLIESRDYLERTQDSLERNYHLSDYERFDVSQTTRELVFSSPGKADVVATVVFVGSFAPTPGTWLWGWANESIDEKLTTDLASIRDHGRKHGFALLTRSGWESSEEEGWDMAAITNYLLRGKGVYRAPSSTSVLWLVMTYVRRDP